MTSVNSPMIGNNSDDVPTISIVKHNNSFGISGAIVGDCLEVEKERKKNIVSMRCLQSDSRR